MAYRKGFINLLLVIFISAFAGTAKAQALFNVTQADVDSAFTALYDAIDHKEEFQNARYKRIREQEKQLYSASEKERIDILKQLIDDHMNFRSKEVLRWIEMLKETPEYKERGDLYIWTECHEAQCYSTMGFTHKALRILHTVDMKNASKEIQAIHDDILAQTYNWEMSTFNFSFPLSKEEEEERVQLQKAIQENSVNESGGVFAHASELMENGRADECIELLRPFYSKLKGQEMTYLYAVMADVYMHKKDTLSAMYALAITSIRDLESANADYMCLPVLVEYLSEKGDIDNAYHFLLCCIDDARQYPAYFLSGETSSIFPIITNEYNLMQQRKKNTEMVVRLLVFAIVLMITVLICFVFYIRKKHMMAMQLEKKNDELTKANEVKSVFIQNMTHELHTPMNSVSGFAQLLVADADTLDKKTQKEVAENIYRSATDLTKQLDNIIALSRLDSIEPHHIEKEEVLVNDIVARIKSKTYIPEGKDLSFEINNTTDVSAKISTDKNMLVDAIGMVLDNSMKFSDSGKVILTIEQKNEKYHFTVTDEGKGIHPGLEKKIFERFFKADNYTPGAGLGLSLCHDMMTLLGGSVKLEKTYGPGAKFVLEI